MRYLWLPLFAVLLSGCSSLGETVSGYFSGKDNTTPPAQLVDFNAKATIDTVWQARAGSHSKKLYVRLLPSIDGNRLFAAGVKGRISAFDVRSGETLWQVDSELPVRGGPGSGEGLVLVGTADAEVVAFSQTDGSERWRARVSSEVLATPQIGKGVVVARSIDGRIFGLNAVDGKRLWIYDSKVPVLSLRGASAPVIDGNGLVAGLADGKLVALRLSDGVLIWESAISVPRGRTELERMVDIDAEPLIADGVVHAVTYQGNVATVALENGRGLWRREMSSSAGLAADKKFLFVTDENDAVWALDRRSGSSYWKQDKLYARKLTAPAVYKEYVIVGDLEGYIHVMSNRDGSFVARSRVGSAPIIAAPIIKGDTIFVSGSDGRVTALRING
ncbi:MAG: outer membrane protein assembly factor BamB [Granulosicoccaceae bacterium]|jgi:outer membrane protein assembly factor BamB